MSSYVPFEAEETTCWTVYDDNQARVVAVFYDRTELDRYLVWRNKRQDKLRARAEQAAIVRAEAMNRFRRRLATARAEGAAGWTGDLLHDDDGRC